MNTALLTFTVNPGRAALASNGQTAAEISFEDGKLSVNLFYDVRKDPLGMEAPASNGDSARTASRSLSVTSSRTRTGRSGTCPLTTRRRTAT